MTTHPVALPTPGSGGLEVVRGRTIRIPRIRGWLFFTLAVIAAFFVLIYSRIALDRSAFELKDIDSQIAVEEARYWELRLDAARLEAPQRIMEMATEMGLVYPATVERLTVETAEPPSPLLDENWAELKVLLSAQP